jgi:hypothetical protein
LRELVALVTAIDEYGIKKDFTKRTEISKRYGNILISDWSGIDAVMFGDSRNIKEKLTRLAKCFDGSETEHKYVKIDLRWNDRIVISI